MSFVDYYEVLQISPKAQPETIHRVFRLLAARYHPDNPETGDVERFLQLNQAYEVLKDPESRAEYNERHAIRKEKPLQVFGLREFTEGLEGEMNRRMGILCLLYNKRRTNPDEAGMSLLTLETLTAIPREHLLFTVWYLRQKGYVEFNDTSEYEITGEGTDHLEEQFPKQQFVQKLLNAPPAAKRKSATDILSAIRLPGKRPETQRSSALDME